VSQEVSLRGRGFSFRSPSPSARGPPLTNSEPTGEALHASIRRERRSYSFYGPSLGHPSLHWVNPNPCLGDLSIGLNPNIKEEKLKRALLALAVLMAVVMTANAALAQSGHFVTGGNNAPRCTDIGTQLQCTGKVAGLGGTTFEITLEATGIATVECINPAGHRAPGQDTAITAAGSSGPLPTPRNGQFVFSVTTDPPGPLPPTPTCPNVQWTPVITDVAFDSATLRLFEDGNLSDTFVVF
jgi:hypothetical protein